jgi:hypothetical protein
MDRPTVTPGDDVSADLDSNWPPIRKACPRAGIFWWPLSTVRVIAGFTTSVYLAGEAAVPVRRPRLRHVQLTCRTSRSCAAS